MLDKKLKEQIYYGNNQQKKEFDNKAFYTLVAVIVGFALIVAIISINSNNTTHYEQPKQERNLGDIVNEKPSATQVEHEETTEKNTTDAFANEQNAKNNPVTETKTTSNSVQKTSTDNNSMEEFYKINSMHVSSQSSNSEYGEFGSFVNDKTPQRTKDVIKHAVKSPSNTQNSKPKSNIEKSQDWFFE